MAGHGKSYESFEIRLDDGFSFGVVNHLDKLLAAQALNKTNFIIRRLANDISREHQQLLADRKIGLRKNNFRFQKCLQQTYEK